MWVTYSCIMFITLTRLNDEEAPVINPVISNKDGGLYVALRGFNYEVGYHNIGEMSVFVLRPSTREYDTITVPGGLYTIEQLSRYLTKNIPALVVRITKSRLAEISIKAGFAVRIEDDLRKILGIDENLLQGGEKYVGNRPVRLPTPNKWFYIYLNQLSTSSNLVDGAPSSLLAIVPATADGDSVVRINPSNPMYKRLQVGNIHQLSLRVLNERGEIFDNNKKPMTAVLEIRHVYYTDSASR